MCGLADELRQTSLAAVNSDWSLFIWVIIYKSRGIILGAVRGFVSRESKTTPNPMANYLETLWEDVSFLDARFFNHISLNWFVKESGVFFFRGEGRFLHSVGHVKNMLYVTSFFTSLLRTYLWIQHSVGLPRMEMQLWWREQIVKTTELSSSSFYFVSAARKTRNDVALLVNTAPSTMPRSASASVTLYASGSDLGPDIACPEWFLCFNILTFRHRASCILGQAFHYSPENAFYIFNQQIYFIIWYLLDCASLI